MPFFKPSRMRRSTHQNCGYCGGNQSEYNRKFCDLCLIELDTTDNKIVSFFKSKFRLIKRFLINFFN